MRILALAVVAAVLVAGCKKHHTQTSAVSTNGDEPAAPGISWTSPAPSETGVAVTAVVVVTFTDEMKSSTITTGTYTLTQDGGPAVSGAVTYAPGARQATFTPAAPLLPSTTYIANLSAFIQNTFGVSLGVGQSWKFTTAP